MLKERMAKMHRELYGDYKEFTGVNMTIEQMYNTSVLKKIDKAEAKAEARIAKFEAKIEVKVAKAEKRAFSQGLVQAAKAMKAAGEAVSKIMNYTGLSRREIMAL
ncbi:MAG: hypothetical protein FWB90_08830 [Fibromonadales bacterium]|nr:hypothetical protein [Fibromonadales bacterium]